MSVNKATLDLIKSFEGFEPGAYQDPVGVWTIGYGHTDAAGDPAVVAGMKVTRTEAEKMLREDIRQYERAVDDAVKVSLNPNQRGALVSFTYNLGPANFRRSSVLRKVNEMKFDEVPARMALWNKAGGRVFRGLVRRRAAEGELFLRPIIQAEAREQRESVASIPVEQDTGAPLPQSTTIWSAIGTVASGGGLAFLGDLDWKVAITGILLLSGFAFWIIRERMKKSREHGV